MTGLVGGDRQGTMFAVVGATGQQGGAIVRALQAQDAGVRALVRDPQAPAARALADGGVQVAQADIDDAESMRRAFTDVDGVFAMTTFAGPAGTSGEVEHGKTDRRRGGRRTRSACCLQLRRWRRAAHDDPAL